MRLESSKTSAVSSHFQKQLRRWGGTYTMLWVIAPVDNVHKVSTTFLMAEGGRRVLPWSEEVRHEET